MIRVHERDVTVHERGHAQEVDCDRTPGAVASTELSPRSFNGTSSSARRMRSFRVTCESGVPWSWSVTINFAG